ncbi:MAG: alpha/beta hydrolase [Kiritimatiellae bacterium]|nr:alpha/beta hydrolase [Kiritimatiellia bacterium]
MKPPTAADVTYGPHERNVLDFWQAESEEPTPVLLSIHGGGFKGGEKGVNPVLLDLCLARGISVVAITYRFSQHAIAPAPFQDCARALQFVRSKANEWNLDKSRIASTGGSAGAGISEWLAYRPDLAVADSPDPLARESTRLRCIAMINAQTSYDPRFIKRVIPGDAYKHPALVQLFDTPLDEPDALPPEKQALIEECSPIHHVTADAPPSLFFYKGDDDPTTALESAGAGIHHPLFAIELKKRLDPLGVACEIHVRTDPNAPENQTRIVDFLTEHLGV